MNTKELIEMIKKVPVGSVLRDEIIQKLRQLEDVKRVMYEFWGKLSEVEELLWDVHMFGDE